MKDDSFYETGEKSGVPAETLPLPVRAALIVLSRWKLLLAAPILGALFGFSATRIMDSYYTSTTTLLLSDLSARNAESIMRSPAVLDTALAKLSDLDAGQSPEERRSKLDRRVTWTITRGDSRRTASVFYLNVSDTVPVRAQTTARIMIERWLELSMPRPDAKIRIEQQIKSTVERARDLDTLYEKLAAEASDKLVTPNTMQGEYATPLNRLRTERAALDAEIRKLQQDLLGLSRDIVIAGPDLPVEVSWPRPKLATAAGAALFGLLALLYIWGTHVWSHYRARYADDIRRLLGVSK